MNAYSSDGSYVASVASDAQGVYSLKGLPTASYRLVAYPSSAPGLLPQVYDNIACPVAGACPVASGTPVAVTVPNTTSDINFALSPWATISGTVTNATTGAPVNYVSVLAYTSDGSPVKATQTDAQGAYSLTGLTTGSYFVRASPLSDSGLLPQVFDSIDCSPFGGCPVTGGTPVAVTVPNATSNINFALSPWATITGTVTNASTAAPVADATVRAYSSEGVEVGWAMTNAQGMFTVTRLPTGSYFLVAVPPTPSGLVGQLYDSITCPAGGCSVTSGTPVGVTSPNATNVNIALSAAPFGQIDTPVQNAAGVQGAIAVTGWALDDVGVTRVEIFRNCLEFELANCQTVQSDNILRSVVYIGDAAFLEGARPDVAAAYPGVPNNARAGWGYLMLTPMLPHVPTSQPYGGQGALTLFAYATDTHGNRKMLGRSSDPGDQGYGAPTFMTMSNDTIAKPFGAIDTPGQGETIGGIFNNFGWALTPDSNTTGGDPGDILIPTDGSTMTVFIDGLPAALVAYNQCRGNVGNPPPAGVYCNDDVSNIFGNPTPQAPLTARTSNPTKFRNLDAGRAAIGAFTFDTSTLTDGLHTIAWSVTDSAGRTEGIGSRFFIVANGSASAARRDEGTIVQKRPARPAAISGSAATLASVTPVTQGLSVRFGFDLAEAWKPLHANDDGKLSVRLPELNRLELWLGDPVDAGYLLVKETLRPLPVGTSLKGSVFAWMPPAGYIGPYHLVFTRGGERIDVLVTVVPKTTTR